MGLRINTNIEAFNAHRSLNNTSNALAKSMQRLSSGYRINSAGDDAAGLGISERMRAQISGVDQASRNCQDGISLVQTAEGSLQEFHSILHRIRDLAVQWDNGTNDAGAKNAITLEVAQLSAELSRMISVASFNGIPLLSANLATSPILATLQVGANNAEILTISAVDLNSVIGLGIQNFINATVGQYINPNSIDTMVNTVSNLRSTFGAVQNRLEHTINALGIYSENLQSAESRIRDLDMAAEMTNFTKLQVLQQSGTAMLAQANQSTSSVLSLLRG